MHWWTDIRRKVLVEHVSKRQIIRELTSRLQEVYIPLSHRHGEAQMDFGYALVKEQGVLRKVAFSVQFFGVTGRVTQLLERREE